MNGHFWYTSTPPRRITSKNLRLSPSFIIKQVYSEDGSSFKVDLWLIRETKDFFVACISHANINPLEGLHIMQIALLLMIAAFCRTCFDASMCVKIPSLSGR